MNLLQRRNSIDMTLGERLNKIIEEQNISKAEFAKRVGITRNYIYILTGNSRPGTDRNKDISPMLAKVIAMEFGYDENWVLKGDN